LGKVLAIFFLAVVVAAVPFFLGLGRLHVEDVTLSADHLLTANMGELLIVGVTVALSAILASVDANEQIKSSNNVFVSSVLSGIGGLFCMIDYCIYTIGASKILADVSNYHLLTALSGVCVVTTVALSLTCYIIVYGARESIIFISMGQQQFYKAHNDFR
jgi:uncharacterized membrane protein YdcZ (DUF606 family)